MKKAKETIRGRISDENDGCEAVSFNGYDSFFIHCALYIIKIDF
jgi:hypothetical protein